MPDTKLSDGERFIANVDFFCAYVDEIFEMATAEGIEINKAMLKRRLSRYSLTEIERIVDAFRRFGVKNICDNI